MREGLPEQVTRARSAACTSSDRKSRFSYQARKTSAVHSVRKRCVQRAKTRFSKPERVKESERWPYVRPPQISDSAASKLKMQRKLRHARVGNRGRLGPRVYADPTRSFFVKLGREPAHSTVTLSFMRAIWAVGSGQSRRRRFEPCQIENIVVLAAFIFE